MAALPLVAALLVLGLFAPSAHAVGASECQRASAPVGEVIEVAPGEAGQLPKIVGEAPAGSTIRLANGTYPVSEPLVVNRPNVTLRSASGDPTGVVLDGHMGPARWSTSSQTT